MPDSITNSDDIIDSRDVIARLAELTEEYDDHTAATSTEEGPPAPSDLRAFADWLESDGDEFAALKTFAEEADGYASDWEHGATLIRDSYFARYAEELAGDIGAIDPKATWPLQHIDWNAAAEALKADYTAIEFGDVTYWVR